MNVKFQTNNQKSCPSLNYSHSYCIYNNKSFLLCEMLLYNCVDFQMPDTKYNRANDTKSIEFKLPVPYWIRY